MNKFIIISLIFLIFSCNKNENEIIVKTDKFYYLSTQYYNDKIDTIPYSVGNQISDSINYIAKSYFLYGDTINMHVIKKYMIADHLDKNNEKIAGTISYTLDDIGLIYNKSTTYSSFGILSSTNDSINRLLAISFGHIIMDEFK